MNIKNKPLRQGRSIDLLSLAISFYHDERFDNNSVRFYILGIAQAALFKNFVAKDNDAFDFLQKRCLRFKIENGDIIENKAVRKIYKEAE